jgi:hypothetical protein
VNESRWASEGAGGMQAKFILAGSSGGNSSSLGGTLEPFSSRSV